MIHQWMSASETRLVWNGIKSEVYSHRCISVQTNDRGRLCSYQDKCPPKRLLKFNTHFNFPQPSHEHKRKTKTNIKDS